MAKGGDDTFVQKLTELHVACLKKLTRVLMYN
jgi:hypothetical protein